MKRWVYIFVALVTCGRIYLAAHYPLTEDEAYYWVWSTHLAFGYLDHPPAVAWLIAAFSWLGHSPLAVRLPFILCEAFAAIFVGYAALALSGSQRAGAVAAIALTLIPQLRWVIGEALPDGPYMLCWSAALWCAARLVLRQPFARLRTSAYQDDTRAQDDTRNIILLGIALGGALLSRFFGWALVAGVLAYSLMPGVRQIWRRGFWIAPLIALVMYAPFLGWNASHSWANFAFTLQARHPMGTFSVGGLSNGSTLRYLLFAAGFCVVGYLVTVLPQRPLLAWTALPFPVALAGLSFFQPVESYWLLGPFASLCAGIGIAFSRISLPVRAIASVLWIAGFVATEFVAASGALHPSAKLGGEAAVYAPLSRDLAQLSRSRNTAIITDSYEIASELVYNGTSAKVVGSSPQARQWSFWSNDAAYKSALFVTSAPHAVVRPSCANPSSGPILHYKIADSQKTYYTFWCFLSW